MAAGEALDVPRDDVEAPRDEVLFDVDQRIDVFRGNAGLQDAAAKLRFVERREVRWFPCDLGDDSRTLRATESDRSGGVVDGAGMAFAKKDPRGRGPQVVPGHEGNAVFAQSGHDARRHRGELREGFSVVVHAQDGPSRHVETLVQMQGGFLCRPGHPLTRVRGAIGFDDISRYPLASTLLDDDIARSMIELYGPKAHPDRCLSLQSNDLGSMVEVVRGSDVVMPAIPRAAPDLVVLPVKPMLPGAARFGLVTLADRTEAPAMPLLREVLKNALGVA